MTSSHKSDVRPLALMGQPPCLLCSRVTQSLLPLETLRSLLKKKPQKW